MPTSFVMPPPDFDDDDDSEELYKQRVALKQKRRGFRMSCCVYERGFQGYPHPHPSDRGMPSDLADEAVMQSLSTRNVVPIGSGEADVPKGIFDAHVHLYDFAQHSDGIGVLLQSMDISGVSHAALFGCPLKKNWSEFEDHMAPDAFNDTDTLYYFSLTDMHIMDELKTLPPGTAARFRPLMCGFKPSDKSAPDHIAKVIEGHQEIQWCGLGKIYTRSSDLTNLTNGTVSYPGCIAFDSIMSEAHNRNLPVLIQHNACAESAKPYKTGFEFVPELSECLSRFPKTDMLWVAAGMFARGQWAGFKEILDDLLTEHSNLYISVTGEALKFGHFKRKDWVDIAEKHPKNVLVGTSGMGKFGGEDDDVSPYVEEWKVIKDFLGGLSRETYNRVRYENAAKMFSERRRPRASVFQVEISKCTNWLQKARYEKNDALHDIEAARAKDMAPPTEKNRHLEGMVDGVLMHDAEIKHVCIDTHLHMLDFLQKSSGTERILKAMDGCGVQKAVLIGMPCCKKWSKDEPERPLYYQDDNGQCYFYAYSDQMVADAWLALPNEKRKRFAPIMGAFNPTDLHAVDHVRRMWDKYPGMWRGLGEVMCRHDDLTTLLQEDETPVINHTAMRGIFEFCIEHNINCLVHHNATRTALKEKGDAYEYLHEVEQVMEEFPDLKLIWCHAGASRRTHEEYHHQMICDMIEKYPSLMIDMSWVVWEEVVCEPGTLKAKQGWVDLFTKHPTRFTMGSDQVGQFISPAGGNLLKPEIVKYWQLDQVLPPDVVKAIMYDNAQRIWFENWDMPTTDQKRFRQIPKGMRCETLHSNEGRFVWENKEMY